MTTAQHSSYLNANLPNLKAQATEMMGEGGALTDDRDHLVPSDKDHPALPRPPMPSVSPVGAAALVAGGEGAGAVDAREQQGGGISATAGMNREQQLLAMGEISVEPNGDVLVKVPADLVGRMIGKHGTVIKELQLQSGAFINMAKEGEVFRIARITGDQWEARLCACLLVDKFTPADNTEKRTCLEDLISHYRAVGNRPARAYQVESMSLPPDMVTRLVGRGGLLLRELQDKTRAKIDLPRSMGGDEMRKVVTISGTTAEVAACRELIRNMGHEPTHYAPDEYYGTLYEPHAVPTRSYYQPQPQPQPYASYAPYMHGQGGTYADPYAQPYLMRSYYYPEQAVPDMGRLSLDSDDHVVPTPREAQIYVPAPMAAAIHVPAQAAAQAAPYMAPPLESVISIPGDMVGRLIGRQGVAVKQLQSETHTRIDILDPLSNAPYGVRHVRITGPKHENIQHCIYLIQTRVSAFWGTPPSPASTRSGQH